VELKSFFSPPLVRRLAAEIARVHPGFPERRTQSKGSP
jgi:hypothetical protein